MAARQMSPFADQIAQVDEIPVESVLPRVGRPLQGSRWPNQDLNECTVERSRRELRLAVRLRDNKPQVMRTCGRGPSRMLPSRV